MKTILVTGSSGLIGSESVKFPNNRMNNEFVGDVFDENENITHLEIETKLPVENILMHGSMIIRKECLDNLGGYRDIRGSEDWDLWKRAMSKGYRFYQAI